MVQNKHAKVWCRVILGYARSEGIENSLVSIFLNNRFDVSDSALSYALLRILRTTSSLAEFYKLTESFTETPCFHGRGPGFVVKHTTVRRSFQDLGVKVRHLGLGQRLLRDALADTSTKCTFGVSGFQSVSRRSMRTTTPHYWRDEVTQHKHSLSGLTLTYLNA